jgi:hypothetical protein
MPNYNFTPEQRRKAIELEGLDPNKFTVTDTGQIVPTFGLPQASSQPTALDSQMEPKPTDTKTSTFFKSLGVNALPSLGGGAGAAGGMALGAALMPTGIGTIPGGAIMLGSALGGGLLGGMVGEKVNEAIIPQDWLANAQASMAENPGAAFAGRLSALPLGGFMPGPSNLVKAAGGATKMLAGMAPTATELANVGNVGIGAALNPAIMVGKSLVSGEPMPPAGELATEAAIGAVFNKPWALGRAMGFHDAPKISEPNREFLDVTTRIQPITSEANQALLNKQMELNALTKSIPEALDPNDVNTKTFIERAKEAPDTGVADFLKVKDQLEGIADTYEKTFGSQLMGERPKIGRKAKTDDIVKYIDGITEYLKRGEEVRTKATEKPSTTPKTAYEQSIIDRIKTDTELPTSPNLLWYKFFNDLGLYKRGYKVQADASLSNKKTGNEVAGEADLQNQLIKLGKAGTETLPHEATHFFAQALRDSKRGRDAQFYKKYETLVEALPEYQKWKLEREEAKLTADPEEYIATNQGMQAWERAVETDSYFQRFKKDFGAYTKTRFGKHATEADFRRMMQYKLYHDPAKEGFTGFYPTAKGGDQDGLQKQEERLQEQEVLKNELTPEVAPKQSQESSIPSEGAEAAHYYNEFHKRLDPEDTIEYIFGEVQNLNTKYDKARIKKAIRSFISDDPMDLPQSYEEIANQIKKQFPNEYDEMILASTDIQTPYSIGKRKYIIEKLIERNFDPDEAERILNDWALEGNAEVAKKDPGLAEFIEDYQTKKGVETPKFSERASIVDYTNANKVFKKVDTLVKELRDEVSDDVEGDLIYRQIMKDYDLNSSPVIARYFYDNLKNKTGDVKAWEGFLNLLENELSTTKQTVAKTEAISKPLEPLQVIKGPEEPQQQVTPKTAEVIPQRSEQPTQRELEKAQKQQEYADKKAAERAELLKNIPQDKIEAALKSVLNVEKTPSQPKRTAAAQAAPTTLKPAVVKSPTVGNKLPEPSSSAAATEKPVAPDYGPKVEYTPEERQANAARAKTEWEEMDTTTDVNALARRKMEEYSQVSDQTREGANRLKDADRARSLEQQYNYLRYKYPQEFKDNRLPFGIKARTENPLYSEEASIQSGEYAPRGYSEYTIPYGKDKGKKYKIANLASEKVPQLNPWVLEDSKPYNDIYDNIKGKNERAATSLLNVLAYEQELANKYFTPETQEAVYNWLKTGAKTPGQQNILDRIYFVALNKNGKVITNREMEASFGNLNDPMTPIDKITAYITPIREDSPFSDMGSIIDKIEPVFIKFNKGYVEKESLEGTIKNPDYSKSSVADVITHSMNTKDWYKTFGDDETPPGPRTFVDNENNLIKLSDIVKRKYSEEGSIEPDDNQGKFDKLDKEAVDNTGFANIRKGVNNPDWAEEFAMKGAQRAMDEDFNEGKYSFEASINPQIDTPEFKKWFGDSKVVDEQGKPLVVYHGTDSDINAFDLDKVKYSSIFGKGMYFTSNPEIAGEYAKARSNQNLKGFNNTDENIMPVFLNLKNPVNMDRLTETQVKSIVEKINEGQNQPYEHLMTDPDLGISYITKKRNAAGLNFDANGDGTYSFKSINVIRLKNAYGKDFTKILKDLGYDGIEYEGGRRTDNIIEHRAFVAFEPTQIKSAIGNKGTFDPNNPDIRYSTESAFLPFLASRIDKVQDKIPGPEGKMITQELHKFAGETDYLTGQFGNGLLNIITDIKPEQVQKVYKYLYDIDDSGSSPVRLTASEKKVADGIVKLLREPRKMQIAMGMLVSSKAGQRTAGMKPNGYMFNMLDPEVAYEWSNNPTSAKSKSYDNAYMAHRIKHGDTAKEAQQALNEYRAALGSRGGVDVEFGALRKAEGKGLPWMLIDKNFGSAAQRYGRRAAKDLAYFKYIQSNSKMLKALNLKDQEGNYVPADIHPDIQNVGSHDTVKEAMRSVYGIDTPRNPKIMAAARVAANIVMGPGTAIRNLATMPAFLTTYVRADQAALVAKAIYNMKFTRDNAFKSNAIKASFADFDAAGAYAGNPDKIINAMDKFSSILRKYQGRDLSNALEGQFYYSIGELLTQDNIVKAKAGNKDAIEFLDKFSDIVEGGTKGLLARKATADDVSRIAKRFTDRIRGTYGEEGLPSWAIEGELAPFAALGRFSIEKANAIYKDVYVPMKKGNWMPFLKYALGSILTGVGIEKINELLTGKRGMDPTVEETLAEPNVKNIATKLVGLGQMASMGGIMSDFAKTAVNASQGRLNQFSNPLSFPLATMAVDTIANNLADYVKAIQDGEDPIDSTANLIKVLTTQSSQTGRYLWNWTGGREDAQEKEKFRDVRAWKEVTGQPVSDFGSRPNEFANLGQKKFKKETDLSKAAEMLPDLFEKAVEDARESNGVVDPYKLKRNLASLKQNNYQTMPNMQNDPIGFYRYYNYLEKTQGKEAAMQRLQDYVMRNAVNKAKTNMVP